MCLPNFKRSQLPEGLCESIAVKTTNTFVHIFLGSGICCPDGPEPFSSGVSSACQMDLFPSSLCDIAELMECALNAVDVGG